MSIPSPAVRARGLARMKEISREDAAKRQRLVAELLAELGRPASTIDRVSAETLAATVVRADRLRMAGRSDLEERRLIVQLQRALGLKPEKPASKPVDASANAVEWLNSFKKRSGPSEAPA